MNIYRYKKNKKLYKIEHLILDMYHLNANAFAGIYAEPYNWKGEQIIFQNKNHKLSKHIADASWGISC